MLIEETLFGTVDKVKDSIERLKAFEPKDRPYWLAFSGGKDSVVILALAKMAGVRYEAVYNVTSVDPPELVRFIKREYTDVRIQIPHDKDGKPITMWSLIRKNTMPPTRIVRYCCEKLKESSGKGTVTITGVRWAESTNRKNNQGAVTIADKNVKDSELGVANYKRTSKGVVILNDDNDEARRTVEVCYRTRKTLVNPIIDWSDEDVWEFIHKYNVPYCELYDKGFKRLGCIGCPMGGKKNMEREFEMYPKYKDMYIRSMDIMAKNTTHREMKFENGEQAFLWWISGGSSEESTDSMDLFNGIRGEES